MCTFHATVLRLTVSNLVICVWKDTVSSATRMFGLRQISGKASLVMWHVSVGLMLRC